LGESDEKLFRPANVAEPTSVFILDYLAYKLRAARPELSERFVHVVHANMTRRYPRAFTGALRRSAPGEATRAAGI
jgi:hypothetical protein